ncbi:hypothetical protein IV494_14120 [Kaistella sp. G5-32]|uniref:Phage protein n=1 Tax=Kaistella gelatinilytica TaxID=2787636 RepID=A0ABS0FF22_9FLAO|nr:hypothetical protein [Kaistella gelatinilytica]MBF8458316.1 hypothetical protein [Kaistella gelatinilytica]
MENQKETRLRILAEGGSIKICSIEKGYNEGFDYFLETSEEDLFEAGLGNESQEIHESFYGAFDQLNDKYPWYKLHLDFIDEDFVDYVADALVEKLNQSNRMFRVADKKNFEEKLGIHLRTKEVEIKTGVFSIEVGSLVKTIQYDYIDFADSYAEQIGQKFKLDSIAESWDTFNGDSFYFVGTIKIVGNSILLLDSDGDVCYVLPADKYKLTSNPLMYTDNKWQYVFTKKKI